MKNFAKNAELALLVGMAVTVFCAGFLGFEESYGGITDTVFRLHILANSDTEEDQRLKLKVRDAVLAETSYIFEDCRSAEESAKAAEANLAEIKAAAERVVKADGYDYTVDCRVTDMDFDTRIYNSITMPAGHYKALRITIGDANGKNWWCVMFPPLCLPGVTNIDEALAECDGVFTAEELDMLQNPENYECRFYILELIEKLNKLIRNK
ncbi:MAG: stage II sporulation protein R [Ruminococcus sp.]|nr:stage II sporulation protein R [Ruminococcus sp.]MCM1381817.1 stage II sporulation protein R [Muribaculaceae bacterium]MCM1479817.1 stage II sporulation protein R [Muribaculaceae bacterium]